MLGAEYALFHVLPNFEKNLHPFFESNNVFGTTRFQLWERCLQGKDLTKWGIVKAGYPADDDKTLADFTEAIQFHLKRVVEVKYLGNFINRILRTNKKPVLVSIKDYLA